MMNTWLLPVHADAHMRIEQLVPYQTNRSIDDISSHTCLHTGDPTRIRQIVTQDQDLFVLFSADNSQHYFFGSKSVPAHNCLFIDSMNTRVDKWHMIEKFPGLWDFFCSAVFRQNTIDYPIVFWHAPQSDHAQITQLVANDLIDQLNTITIQDWRYELQDEILPHWSHDDWPLLYRLVEATLRSTNDRADAVSSAVSMQLNIDNIDLKVDRRRVLKQAISEQLLNSALIGKLLSAMRTIQDHRASATEFAIMSCLCNKLDQLLVASIKQHLSKYHYGIGNNK